MHTASAIPLLSRPSCPTLSPVNVDGGSGSNRPVVWNCVDDIESVVFFSNERDFSGATSRRC